MTAPVPAPTPKYRSCLIPGVGAMNRRAGVGRLGSYRVGRLGSYRVGRLG